MNKVSKPRPSGYDVCDFGALMGMTQFRLALSLAAYTCPLNFEVLHLKGNHHFAINHRIISQYFKEM